MIKKKPHLSNYWIKSGFLHPNPKHINLLINQCFLASPNISSLSSLLLNLLANYTSATLLCKWVLTDYLLLITTTSLVKFTLLTLFLHWFNFLDSFLGWWFKIHLFWRNLLLGRVSTNQMFRCFWETRLQQLACRKTLLLLLLWWIETWKT